MEYKITLPHCYKWLAAGNPALFKSYVIGFVKSNEPDLKPVRIEGDNVICVKKL